MEREMSTASFQLIYGGPALQNNQMDIRDLAPALLSLGQLFEETNFLLNGNKATISVRVKAGFENGSFGVSIDTVQSVTAQLTNLFTRENIRSASEIAITLGFIYGAGKGLIWVLKKFGNKKVEEIVETENGNFKLRAKDLELEVPPHVFKSYKNLNTRKGLEGVIKPLEKAGIEDLKLVHEKKVETIIEKKEVEFFKAPDVLDEQINEDVTEKSFTIHSLSFREDNKWKLSDGTNTFWVTIKDEDFLNRVNENQEIFTKGDILKVKLRTKQWQTSEGLKTEYEAEKILEHKSGAIQLKLPLKGKSNKF